MSEIAAIAGVCGVVGAVIGGTWVVATKISDLKTLIVGNYVSKKDCHEKRQDCAKRI